MAVFSSATLRHLGCGLTTIWHTSAPLRCRFPTSWLWSGWTRGEVSVVTRGDFDVPMKNNQKVRTASLHVKFCLDNGPKSAIPVNHLKEGVVCWWSPHAWYILLRASCCRMQVSLRQECFALLHGPKSRENWPHGCVCCPAGGILLSCRGKGEGEDASGSKAKAKPAEIEASELTFQAKGMPMSMMLLAPPTRPMVHWLCGSSVGLLDEKGDELFC